MLPCEPDWGSPGSCEAQREGLSPVTWAQLPTPAYQATDGDLGFMLLGCMG